MDSLKVLNRLYMRRDGREAGSIYVSELEHSHC